MGFFDKIKQGIDASMAGLTGEGPSEEALASLSPEQRARYDAELARIAEAEAEAASNMRRVAGDRQQRHDDRPLHGPAGDHVYGGAPAPMYPGSNPEEMLQMSGAEQIEWSMQQSKLQFQELRKNPFGRKKAVPPPSPTAGHDTRPPRQVQADERAARDAARAPYLAEARWPVTVSRIATRGKTQVADVAAWLASSGLAGRGDLVYGTYRVPDRISPGMGGGEDKRVVEWDIVHAATEQLTAAPAPATSWFDGSEQWVARSIGEPSVLDEDLAAAFLLSAGIGPEQTLGISRQLSIKAYSNGEDSSYLWSRVEGVRTFQAAGLGAEAHQQMAAARPIAISPESPAGIHTEVLNWRAVQKAIHPELHQPPALPSPFPYLPSTPQELIQAYLEVVGLYPGDCYGTQATADRARSLVGQSTGTGFMTVTSNTGAAQACADGKPRRRLAGTSLVVFTYRDRPEYAAGRERWATFMAEVYQGDLRKGLGTRRPVESDSDGIPRGLRTIAKVANVVDKVTDGFNSEPPTENQRYCWPPTPR